MGWPLVFRIDDRLNQVLLSEGPEAACAVSNRAKSVDALTGKERQLLDDLWNQSWGDQSESDE